MYILEEVYHRNGFRAFKKLLAYKLPRYGKQYDMPKRILAVDDNPHILQALQDILEFSGYEVDTLLDGNSVFETIAQNPPDLILLDVMLGGIDGRDICHAIKEDDQTHEIPVILISATHNLQDAMEQEGGRPDDFVAKPFDIDHLLSKIQRFLPAA